MGYIAATLSSMSPAGARAMLGVIESTRVRQELEHAIAADAASGVMRWSVQRDGDWRKVGTAQKRNVTLCHGLRHE